MTIELTFRVLDHHPNDGWSRDGERITDTAHLDRVRSAFAAFRILVIKHWHYRGARAPNHVVVEDFDEFLDYLKEHAVAGDAVDVYDITDAICDDRCVVSGKCPDGNGEVPSGGAY